MLGDWLHVLAMTQEELLLHFKNQADGPLIFDATTFAQNLSMRLELEVHASSFANALSLKKPHAAPQEV
jgi:hypothetical protein